MHNRAHPRHYRSEYVRGYLHRQADVYSIPGWSQLVIPYIYRVIPTKFPLSLKKVFPILLETPFLMYAFYMYTNICFICMLMLLVLM